MKFFGVFCAFLWLRNGDRERQEAECEDEQGQDRDYDSFRSQGFHDCRLGVGDSEHDCQKHRVEKAARTAVPPEAEKGEGGHGDESQTSDNFMCAVLLAIML